MKRIILLLLFTLCASIAFADFMSNNDVMDKRENAFFKNNDTKIGMIFPVALLLIAAVFTLIDFGAVGVILGCLGGLAGVTLMGFIPLSWPSLVSFAILSGLLIFKVRA